MRRMILTSLVLLPVMAHAQARTSTVTQPSPSSAANEAELTQPVATTELALKASAKAMPYSSKPTIPPAFRESVQLQTTDNFTDAALIKGGTMEFAMLNTPTENSGPKMTRAVEVSLTDAELAEQPAVSKVLVHAMVDANGVPRNVAVTKSGGRAIDRRAVEAVNQFRFTPATVDNKATWSTVSIAIQIQKQ